MLGKVRAERAPGVRTLNSHLGRSSVYDVRSSFDRRTYTPIWVSPGGRREVVPAALERGTIDDYDRKSLDEEVATPLRH